LNGVCSDLDMATKLFVEIGKKLSMEDPSVFAGLNLMT